MAKKRKPDPDKLPTLHRTIRLPGQLWQDLKILGIREGKPVRSIIHDALDSQLGGMVGVLKELGFHGDELENDKLVRAPLDDNVIAKINYARRQTGLPAVEILRLCLARFLTTEAGEVSQTGAKDKRKSQ
ncbi:MAG: hypothetical protein QGH15_21235 [Kiritimatiellia bacterium]|nr:hypothetical protein [Kiritimatiellia bacterium]